MIEIYRKGFRLDIPTSQVVTFKKSQNLNGVQNRYSYSNTISLEKTANNLKLLDLPELPNGKLNSLQKGYEVDIVINGSIQLKNQILKITKEGKNKIDIYLLYSDSSVITKLKDTFINSVVSDLKYKKTFADFTEKALNIQGNYPVVFTQTQSDAGLYVVEEMPQLIKLTWLIDKLFRDISYTVYGDFINEANNFKDYYIAPNSGLYQIYSSGDGFYPNFESSLNGFDLLNYTLAFFNCYATIDDTYRTVIINSWSNLKEYKNNFKDLSKYFLDYQDFTFQSKLAKKNVLKYSDSGDSFNSFFTNNLSSQDSAVYLDSNFGSGSTKLFADAKVDVNGLIPLRQNNEVGETSAVRVYKISSDYASLPIYENGIKKNGYAKTAVPVSMRVIYTDFHKDYTGFILTPLIQNIKFRYDEILATDFSMTDVFFIEQQSAYYIPLEINLSTKKDEINVRAMLIKDRKFPSPILNNFNSVLLDFKQKVIFSKTFLLSMYPVPPNEFAWDELIIKRYNEDLNKVFVNGVFIPSNSLPQVFNISSLNENSIVIESNKDSDINPDKNTDSLYIQAVDLQGGLSNEAYITLKHTGVASLESNFEQMQDYAYNRNNFDRGGLVVNLLEYVVGSKPNLNNTIDNRDVNKPPIVIDPRTDTDTRFNLIYANDSYANVKIKLDPFSLYLRTRNIGIGKARASVKIIVYDGDNYYTVAEYGSANNQTQNINVPSSTLTIPSLRSGKIIRIYAEFDFDNRRGSNSGAMEVWVEIKEMKAAISTIKSI
jgi:uncharacterized membrane protein